MIEFMDCNSPPQTWVMRLDKGKVYFNREKWPEAQPDDFALATIRIIEKATLRMNNWDTIKKLEKNDQRK